MGSKSKTTTTQQQDPYGPTKGGLNTGIVRATEGLSGATPYKGRFSPTTSSYTTGGLASFGDLLSSMNPSYGRSALNAGDYLWGKIQSGGMRPGVYDPQAAIESATRPIFEKYSESLLPGLGSMLTSSGGYQGAAPGGTAGVLGDTVAKNLTREVSQAAGEQSLAAADLNSRNLLQGNDQEMNALGGLSGLYAGGLNAAMLFPQLQGQVGALDEGIAGRDITEALTRSNYDNTFWADLVSKYQPLLMDPATAFGKTTNVVTQKQDPITQALQALAAGAGTAAQMVGLPTPGGLTPIAGTAGRPGTVPYAGATPGGVSGYAGVPGQSFNPFYNPFTGR